ncbi:hypothetical protein V1515DRAFT_584348 [Lipomyces mesembrius]
MSVSTSSTIVITIYKAPTALHGYSAGNLQQAIRFAVFNEPAQHQKQELFERIVAVGESTYSSMNDQGRRSTKLTDAGLIYYYDRGTVLTIIMGVGGSESLQNFGFVGKTDAYSTNERPAFVEAMNQIGPTSPFGPYRYREYMDTAVLEVFKRDQNTGTLVVQNGQMVVQGGSLDIGLTIGDMLPPNEFKTSKMNACTLGSIVFAICWHKTLRCRISITS